MAVIRKQRRVQGKKVNYWIDEETGEEFSSKPRMYREYKNADATLIHGYLVNKDWDSTPLKVLALYCAAVSLTPEWGMRPIQKVQQLFLLSKYLRDYAPGTIREYCKCAKSEAYRLSKALRSIQRDIQPYIMEDLAWAYELAWIAKINAECDGSGLPGHHPPAAFVGDKTGRIEFALDLIDGCITGLNNEYQYPDGWGVGWDTRIVRIDPAND